MRFKNWLLSMGSLLCVAGLASGCTPYQIQPQPIAAERLLVQGVQALREGRLQEAAGAFQIAATLDNGPSPLDGLGCVKLRQGDLESAERYFHLALERDEGYSHAYGHLALIAIKRGDSSRAIAYYTRALDIDPLNIEARGNFARYLSDKGYKEVAVRELLKGRAVEQSGVEH